jgi:hypothetical protein
METTEERRREMLNEHMDFIITGNQPSLVFLFHRFGRYSPAGPLESKKNRVIKTLSMISDLTPGLRCR